MPVAKKIHGREIWALNGRRISKDVSSFSHTVSRTSVNTSAWEDRADTFGKGPETGALQLTGASMPAELAFLQNLGDTSARAAYSRFLESDITLATPAPTGSPALLVDGVLTGFDLSGERGALRSWVAALQHFGRLYYGAVLYSNVGMAALTASGVSPVKLNLGALGDGQVLAATFHVVNPPGIVGTTPSIIGKVRSDSLEAFGAPIDRLTFTTVTTTEAGFILTVDGDVTPISDTWWDLAWTIAGALPQYTVMSGLAIVNKQQ
jgi:hypothetical protein